MVLVTELCLPGVGDLCGIGSEICAFVKRAVLGDKGTVVEATAGFLASFLFDSVGLLTVIAGLAGPGLGFQVLLADTRMGGGELARLDGLGGGSLSSDSVL